MGVRTDIDLEELLEICLQMEREDLLDFIKHLNIEVADFDFTEELRDYFVKELDKEDSYIED